MRIENVSMIDNMPTLPANIVNEIRSFERGERRGVMPVDNPTVPYAETTSKNTRKKAKDSIDEIIEVIKKMKVMLIIKIKIALFTLSYETLL